MTKHLCRLVCLSVILIDFYSASANELNRTPKSYAKLAAREPVTIVCLGDSVTGIYYHTGGLRAYPEMIAVGLKLLDPQCKATVINAGISGNSTIDALNRLKKDVLDHRPDLVTVMFGLNDIVRVPKPEFQANLKSIINQCRAHGAEVMLCTPNGIYDTPGRPTTKLEEYNQAMKDVASETQAAFCDVYAAYQSLRKDQELEFRLMLSDPFHPNMDGHKLNAETILKTLTGQTVSLTAIGSPPPLTKTKALIEAKQPVRVHAMAPYDQWIAAAIQAKFPAANVEVTTWDTKDLSLAQLHESAKTVRALSPKPNLVVVAIPVGTTPKLSQPADADIDNHSWVLNYALSFGIQEWDVIAITPGVLSPNLSADDQERDRFSRRMIFAQDLPMIIRPESNTEDAQTILTKWLAK